jgi:very-short-patch-repair endonuclease
MVLSHGSAAALWGIHTENGTTIHVAGPGTHDHRQPGLVAHRSRTLRREDRTHHDDIPVTTPLRTLLDLGTCLPAHALEAAINEADKLDLIEFSELRVAMDEWRGQRGVRPLREILDRGEFVLTDSELERRFLPIARRAGLPTPLTQARVNGFRVDFHWPELGLVIETDGLRYHRTPSAQRKDRLRDQTHIAAGLIPLRFTHWQVRHDRQYVERTLRVTASRCRASAFSRDWGS